MVYIDTIGFELISLPATLMLVGIFSVVSASALVIIDNALFAIVFAPPLRWCWVNPAKQGLYGAGLTQQVTCIQVYKYGRIP